MNDPKESKETVVDDARTLTVRLDPFRRVTRVGKPIQVRFVRLSYNLTRLTIQVTLVGPALDEDNKPVKPLRTIRYDDRKAMPDWAVELLDRYMPRAFSDPAAMKRADRLLRREQALRGAIPVNAHPDMIMD